MTQAVYSVASLAEHWGCGTDTVYGLIHSGTLPAFKLGGKLLRIRGDEVEKFECRSLTASNDTEAFSPSATTMKTANATDIRLERLTVSKPKPPRAESGKAVATASR